MEISKVSGNTIKIKGKNATIVVDPVSTLSGQANAVLLMSKKSETSFPKIEDLHLTINGEGEYEVGGIKITGINVGDDVVYIGEVDGGRFVLGQSGAIEKALSKFDETQVLIVNAGQNFNTSIVSTLSPSAFVVYGEGSTQALKALGREGIQKVSKYSIKSDKLPEEAEFISLE